ncbi:hypothetical protein [Streptosporangium saharense]|uniref:Uncharacterized protein n=1 Tax=Streptosporangium saharense TaxID=1706840 RepID=A0A7W7QW54_9ACTN|nr:hypothetical protein [Streptosporangium saharense]MBB4920902.1 hypothetical protein [Streptosporangium saharense]
MPLFNSKKKQARQAAEAEAVQAREEAKAQDQRRRAREDAWRADRNKVLARFRDAEHAYNAARRTYDRYAPGPQKDRAGAALNTAADQLAAVEAELAALDQFADWSRNH